MLRSTAHPPFLFYAKAVVANVSARALRVYALLPHRGGKGRPPPPFVFCFFPPDGLCVDKMKVPPMEIGPTIPLYEGSG
jgi:hypothetical protein